MRIFLITGMILSITFGLLHAQWSRSVSIQSNYDDNAFRNYQDLSDYATRFSFYLAREHSAQNWQSRFFYRGSLTLFTEYNERNYHHHQIGGAWARMLSEKGHTLNLGVNGSLRANGDVYNYYDFKEASGYGNLRFNLSAATIAQIGYRLRGRSYSNLPALTYMEHYLFARYTHFFQTKTTLIFEGNYGGKLYREQVSENTEAQSGMTDNQHNWGGMWGMGNRSWQNSTNSTSLKPGVGQWVGLVRLAQSVSGSTGLSADLTIRKNPSDGVRYLPGQGSGYTTEDELFDDRYGYESEEMSATLTQLLPLEMTFKAGVESKWKDYVNRPALNIDGEPLPSGELRLDRQTLVWLSLSKSFLLPGGKSLELVGEFYWMNNHSNDMFYDYEVSLISLGLASSF
jgi:hypothetical protein